MRRLGGLALAFAMGIPSLAQASTVSTNATGAGPLNVTTEVAYNPGVGFKDTKPGDALVLHLKYTGAKRLKGYVVLISFKDPETGKKIWQTWIRGAERQPIDLTGKESVINFENIPHTDSGELAKCETVVHLVVYEDGTTWGPAKSDESHDLLTILQGASMLGSSQ